MQNLAISDKTPSVLQLVLHPTPTAFVRVSGAESRASYLSKCKQNIQAELWGFYRSKINPRFPNWRAASMDAFYVTVDSRNDRVILMDEALEDEVSWNLVLHQDRLCVLCPRRDDHGNSYLKLVAGKRIADPYNSGHEDVCHILGYIRPYIRDLEAIAALSASKAAPILQDIASPGESRTAFDFHEPRAFSNTVPSNPLQRSIIEALGTTIECIQGPPGTGKSTTIFHILSTRLPDQHTAIVTCIQNKAVDSIAEKLAPIVAELPFYVIGRKGRLGDTASRFTVDAQAQRSGEVLRLKENLKREEKIRDLLRGRLDAILDARIPVKRGYWVKRRMQDAADPLLDDRSTKAPIQIRDPWRLWWEAHARVKHAGLVEEIAAYRRRCDHLRTQALPSALKAAETSIVESARAVLGTLDGLASAQTAFGKTIAIVDEAGTVPEYKIPLLVSLGALAIVAIGDQNQLEPFTHDTENVQKGFFQRVVESAGGRVPMLREQYRMHPKICDFVSKHFYNGELTTNPAVALARDCADLSSIVWRDYADADAESSDAKQRCNMWEVEMVTTFMEDEVQGLLRLGKSVAIITFYKHQLRCLMDAGERSGLVRSSKEMKELAKNKKQPVTRFKHPNFRIVTVDAAQGSEADVVVLSCVRCNARRDLGFLTNRNRMCVALSRARERLIVVASSRTLKSDPIWRALYEASLI